jgi:hypothetical protein
MATGIRNPGASTYASAAHNTTVAADPQVPGPGRMRPMPKKVATRVAQGGVRSSAGDFMQSV